MKRGLYGLDYPSLTVLKFIVEEHWLRVECQSVGHLLLTRLLDSIYKAILFLQENNYA